jgi:hypothetical protein
MRTTTDIAIIGAGPYGLSIAAHLHRRRPFRIFGRPMHNWQQHMPDGLCLKSEGFASTLYAPADNSTLKYFCRTEGLPYADCGIPVELSTLVAYGLWFQQQFVPELEPRCVQTVEPHPGGFLLRIDSGEALVARRVVVAVGITHFPYLPRPLAGLGSQYASHSYDHHDLRRFRDQDVTVVGGGASALDVAGLLTAAGARARLLVRQPAVRWCPPPVVDRTMWQRIQAPQSKLGTGWKLCALDTPALFHRLPSRTRRRIVRTWLGPMGGWSMRPMVEGRVPQMLGYALQDARVQDGRVTLQARGADGHTVDVTTDHVIAATGYKVDLTRLNMLSESLRHDVTTVEGVPLLSGKFESSVPGLHFVGLASANSFGPSMRFMAGAQFTARTLTSHFS